MANLNFPSSPVNGQTYSFNGVFYTYDATIGSWVTTIVTSPLTNGNNTQLLFNDAGAANGSYGAVFDKTSNTVFVNDIVSTLNVSATYFKGNGIFLTGVIHDLSPAYDQANAIAVGANAYANLVWSRANVSMNLDSVNATRYIVFDDAVTGILSRANVSYGLTYEPSSNTLTASGNLVVGTSTSTTKFDLNGAVVQNIVAVAASAVDCSKGNYFTKTASGALGWTVTNVPASRSYSFLLELTNGGSGTQTWFSGTKWASGTAPTLTTSGVDLLGFITDDGGTTWNGIVIGKDLR